MVKDQDSAAGPVAEITVPLTAQAAAELDRLHRLTGLSQTDIVNRAVTLNGFLHDELVCGGLIQLTRSNGEILLVELS